MHSSAARIRVPKGPWSQRKAAPPVTLPTLLKEFELAAGFQKSLQSTQPHVPGYDLFTFSRAAHHLTGDYVDYFPLSGGRVGILVADASGKGISGALLAMAFHSVVRNLPNDRYERPSLFMKGVNTLLRRAVRPGLFVSAIYGVLDPERHQITVSNAGHLPMLVHQADRDLVTSYARNAPVLGVLRAKQYDPKIAEVTVSLSPRDRLLMFTDGVNEAKATTHSEFGFKHLNNRLIRDRALKSKELIANLVDEVDIHRSGWEQSDDITIVAAQRQT